MTHVNTEIAVIGAGMFGSAAAKYLCREGADVVVIGPPEPSARQQANQHTFAAHYDQARICRRLGWDPVWASLDCRSLERFREIERTAGTDFFTECGSLILIAGSIAHRTSAILEQSRGEDIAAQRLSADDLQRRFPSLGLPPLAGGVEGLLEEHWAGHFNPRKLVAAQLKLARQSGGRFFGGVVARVEKRRQNWDLDIDTPGGLTALSAEKLVVATGALTNHNGVLPSEHQLAMKIFTEPNLMVEVTGDAGGLADIPSVVVVDPEDVGNSNLSIYLIPPVGYPNGRRYLRIGPGMQPLVKPLHSIAQVMDWYSGQSLTSEQRDFLSNAMHTVAPNVRQTNVQETCCVIEKTATGYPYIGPLDEADDNTVTIAVGGNGHGARGSDEIGRLTANFVSGKPWDSPIAYDNFRPVTVAAQQKNHIVPDSRLKPPFGLC